MFDPPAQVPYAKIDPAELDSAEHRNLARRLAAESMVLLKNDGTLPLRSVKRIALIGPLAEQTRVLLGNYTGTPTRTVSVLEGMKAEFPQAQINYVPGTQFLSTGGEPVPLALFTTADGRPGLAAEYNLGSGFASKTTPLVTRVEPGIDLNETDLPHELNRNSAFAVHWTGRLNPTETGDYVLGLRAGEGFARLSLAGRHFVQVGGPGAQLGRIHLEKGTPVMLEVEYRQAADRNPRLQLIWAPAQDAPDPAAVAAAREADVVVAVVGITSQLEGEEMPVDQPGFSGGDRTSLDLPKPEEDLLQAVSAAGKPLIVVLMNGSALGANWEKAHANAILEAWYSGEEGGAAIAATLSGKNNPAGRLPVTFYQNVQQLPHFEDYSMKGRTYRYFTGEPLWPFGFGLSYTTFQYSGLTIPDTPLAAGDSLDVAVTVTNTGKLAGDEVVQLYLKFPDVPGAPIRALRGFQRVHLAPGAHQKVAFRLEPRALSMVDEAGNIIVAAGKYALCVGGGQPGPGVAFAQGDFEVNSPLALPE
jgi:beta-glucosidase